MSDLIKTRKGIFIPDITVEMFRNASLEAVEELLVSGEMQDIILPSAEPERLTDDDFETIRIHLNAYKENLCNQQRWEEAEEYQRIIDRFMAFASAEPEREIYANMPDANFEKWLHDHGICNPNIHESIPCSCVPLLIDSAINEIPSAEPEPIRINLNESIKVKLTDWGKEIYYHQYDRINQIYGREICKPSLPKEDENGYAEFQLWCFMELYGMHIGITLPNVIEPIEIVYER